jgi:hypothetical protein
LAQLFNQCVEFWPLVHNTCGRLPARCISRNLFSLYLAQGQLGDRKLTIRADYLPAGSPYQDVVAGSAKDPVLALLALVLVFTLLALLLLVRGQEETDLTALFRRHRASPDGIETPPAPKQSVAQGQGRRDGCETESRSPQRTAGRVGMTGGGGGGGIVGVTRAGGVPLRVKR